MKFENKIKKIIDKEGDLLIRERKNKILSEDFLSSARSYLPTRKKQCSFKIKQVFAVAVIAALVVCFIVSIPLFLRDNETAKEPVSTNPDTPNIPPVQNNQVLEPSLWVGYADTPYAIVKINEITDDMLKLSQNGVIQNYIKIIGEVNTSYNTECFNVGENSKNDFIFDETTEFYITEKSIDKFNSLDTVLIRVFQMNLNYRFYYGPITNDDGISECLPIVDSKLQIKDEDYNSRSFVPLQHLNNALGEIKEYLDRGGEENALTQAIPMIKIINGTTVEEIDEFLKDWHTAKTVYYTTMRKYYSDVPI